MDLELAGREKLLYPIGQVFEHDVGLDSIFFSKNRKLWRMFSPGRWYHPFSSVWKPGLNLEPQLWENISQELNSSAFPIFKCNLFIQYKRPDYLTNGTAGEYSYWSAPYYRYYLDPHQHGIISKLEAKISPAALVAYCAPAFWTFDDLFTNQRNAQLIEHSNFVKPSHLDGHSAWTYTDAGTDGKAFSEPVKIPSLNLRRELEELAKILPQVENNTEFIISLSTSIERVVKEDEGFLAKRYVETLHDAKLPSNELAQCIAHIWLFTFMFDISWAIGY